LSHQCLACLLDGFAIHVRGRALVIAYRVSVGQRVDFDRVIARKPQIANRHRDQVAIEDAQVVANRLDVADREFCVTGCIHNGHQLTPQPNAWAIFPPSLPGWSCIPQSDRVDAEGGALGSAASRVISMPGTFELTVSVASLSTRCCAVAGPAAPARQNAGMTKQQ
jgi:hypothetical protein